MKTKSKVILSIALVALPTAAYTALTSFSEIEARFSGEGTNNVQHGAAAVGYNGYAGWWSIISGQGNWAHESSMAVGHTNYTKNMSGAVGWGNDVNYGANGQYPRHSFAAGHNNTVLGSSSFASGYNNDVAAYQAAALGNSLVVTSNNTTVVGKYNDDKAGVSFVVGNGSNSSNRANALEVYNNGDIIVQKSQGDISMGDFGN